MNDRPKILIADDDHVTRTLLEETLALEGYRVRSVADGASVLGAVLRDRPDLVVLDVMMPGTDGFSVLQRLRDEERTSGVPVLMLTALDDDASTWRGWAGGANYYMSKPFETQDLLRVIRTLTAGAAA